MTTTHELPYATTKHRGTRRKEMRSFQMTLAYLRARIGELQTREEASPRSSTRSWWQWSRC